MRVPSDDYSVSRIPPKLQTESVNKNLRSSDTERYPGRVRRKVVRVSGKPTKPLSRRRAIDAVLAAPGSSQKNSRPSRGNLRERSICSAKGVNLLFTITAYEKDAFWLRLNMEWAPVAEHIGARFIFGRAYILASARPKPRTAPAHERPH